MEGGDSLKNSLSWLHGVINGKIGHGLEVIALQGLRVIHAEKGFMRFDFVVPNAVSDVDGYWSVAALASLLDVIGVVTTYSFSNRISPTIDFNVSYYSTIMVQVKSFLFNRGVHVEIESKVNANRGKLMHVVIEVRRKGNGELIAEGKLWMAASTKFTLAQVSKL
ncbi:Thioesterase superfamily [Gossypium australe]|uniref:Thioesterase superfamily n=1 Tax=Gossypium australe TaxID=47621 RepID=A0A5B6UEE6_9ROSI|nr:Thioesterase superfamily [Gossypium australe]